MQETYTFTARSAVDPSRVVTLTLHDHRLSVGTGPPLEQFDRAVSDQEEAAQESPPPTRRPWLRPLAISLLQRSVKPFPVHDVSAAIDDAHLSVRAWYRARGLRLLPVTLIDGRVDNPEAAQAFVDELSARKAEAGTPFGVFELLDYWATWGLALVSVVAVLVLWRRRADRS